MRYSTFRTAALLSLIVLSACSSQSIVQSRPGALGINDFLLAFNSYSTAQTYLKRGRHAEAVAEYQESLKRYGRLDEATRTRLRTEVGLSQEQVERELSLARALAQQHTTLEGGAAQRERFRERVLAGFYPYTRGTPRVGKVGPGIQIAGGNWQIAQNLLPAEILEYVQNGDFSILVQATTDLPPHEEYIVATLGAGDQVQLVEKGSTLKDYSAGLPFPVLDVTDPESGLKAAWNIRYRDAGDRIEQWADTVARDAKSEKQYAFSSYSALAFGMHRAKAEHNVPDWQNSGIVSKEYFQVLTLPFGNTAGPLGGGPAGEPVGILRYRYNSDHRPVGQWITSPGNGKFRSVAYNPESPALGFTMIVEDVLGEQIPTLDWRLVTTKIALVPGFVQDKAALFGGTGGGYPIDGWELRFVHVLETIPRSPNHPYSRRVMYVDQQTLAPLYAMMFDDDNAHWRTMFYSYGHPRYAQTNQLNNRSDTQSDNQSDTLDVRVPILLGRSWIDYHLDRTTVSTVNKARYNHALSLDMFTFSRLMQRGK